MKQEVPSGLVAELITMSGNEWTNKEVGTDLLRPDTPLFFPFYIFPLRTGHAHWWGPWRAHFLFPTLPSTVQKWTLLFWLNYILIKFIWSWFELLFVLRGNERANYKAAVGLITNAMGSQEASNEDRTWNTRNRPKIDQMGSPNERRGERSGPARPPSPPTAHTAHSFTFFFFSSECSLCVVIELGKPTKWLPTFFE